MKVVIIGSGNIATIFGRLIKKAGHEITEVFSRQAEHAQILANELQCGFTDKIT
ncbi:MAG: NAD(P)-binding domain-containing protein [Ferruginibacter sp.]